MRVLAVDDEAGRARASDCVLEAAGAQVTTASSAPTALEIIGARSPDVLVADIGMPEMDGFELIRRIRAQPTGDARLPAAALTAFARSEDRTKALQSGFEMHLAKPVDPGELGRVRRDARAARIAVNQRMTACIRPMDIKVVVNDRMQRG